MGDTKKFITDSFDDNVQLFTGELKLEDSFDLMKCNFYAEGRRAIMFFIDGFMNGEISEKILESLMDTGTPSPHGKNIKNESAAEFASRNIPFFSVNVTGDVGDLADGVFAGLVMMLVEGLDAGILIDARSYPQRPSSEPEKDKVFRGSRDGFLESVVQNAALIRRRIRSPRLHIQKLVIGKSTKTDVAVCAFDGRADRKLVAQIIRKLTEMSETTDGLPMNQETLSEKLFPPKWFSVFPKVKFTERPDTASAQLLKGSIIILVDNSPSAMILPVNFFEIMEEANDHYFPPLIGGYQKFCIMFVSLVSVFWTPIWMLLNSRCAPADLPEWCRFLLIQKPAAIPLIIQLLLLEIVVDGLKLASLNTPNMLTTSLGMVGALVVSDFAVESGWFSAEALLYTAFIAIATYSQPDFQMGYAFKFVRIGLLLAVWAFGLPGLLAGIGLLVVRFIADGMLSRKEAKQEAAENFSKV